MNALAITAGIIGIYLLLGYLNGIGKPAPGLSYTTKHLESIFPAIVFYPLEEQAKYADHICQHMVSEANLGSIVDKTELEGTFSEALRNPDYTCWSATSVGNIAYIALHSKDSAMKKAGKSILADGANHFKQQQKKAA